MRAEPMTAGAGAEVARDGPAPADRDLYVAAADPEGRFPDGAFVAALRAETQRPDTDTHTPADLGAGVSLAAGWGLRESARYRDLAAAAGGAREALVRRAALGCAPLALNSGAWLQWLSSPANADDPASMSVLALYASDVGAGHPRASRGNAYLALLRALRLSENAAPAARLALDRRIADWAFRLPAALLAMSRRPDDFTPEILGADLCLRAVGLPPPLALVRDAHPHAADWAALDPGTARGADGDGGLDRARAAAEMVLAAGGDGAARAALRGFGWALAALTSWSARVYGDLDAARDPAYEMAELLRLRAREGSAYHQHFEIEGRTLSAWLEESRTDPAGLLDALCRSKLIKPGESARSVLVNGLVGERGRMFRVFAPEDLDVIRRWIDSLAPGAGGPRPPAAPARPEKYQPLEIPVPAPQAPARRADTGRISLREAYHGLIRRNESPALRQYARDYVHGWLNRARLGVDEGETRLPAVWEPGSLRPWLLEQHDKHGRDFQSTAEGPVPSREALVDSTVQLAPLTLIDGGWLQGFTDYEHASSELGHFLFETYWDELGNGIPRLNHPLIYRQVLAEMGVRLPPTGSAQFAHSPVLRDASFELPVYWLSIGRSPQSFMPEILGLNLAMELSGVGGTYRRAHIALKKYGFSTRFVDIHNTIDNVATGHSAWAADAVDSYLAALLVARGAGAQAEAWQRVRTGFRSLSPPDGRRARRAERRGRQAGAAR